MLIVQERAMTSLKFEKFCLGCAGHSKLSLDRNSIIPLTSNIYFGNWQVGRYELRWGLETCQALALQAFGGLVCSLLCNAAIERIQVRASTANDLGLEGEQS